MSVGLAPHDRRLRSGRYEVTGFRVHSVTPRVLRPTTPMARFATEAAARAYAATLTDEVVVIDRVAPANSRYPDGPWSTTTVSTPRAAA